MQVRPTTYTALMIQRFSASISGEYYHIYNRGTDKRIIFKTPSEFGRFELLLKRASSPHLPAIDRDMHGSKDFLDLWSDTVTSPLISIGAWCLMPNHFHLLVRENTEDGIAKFMQKLCTAYSMYYNSKHSRTGTLFEGRYKIKHIDTDTYMHWLYAYIHLNPLKLKRKEWRKDIENNKQIPAEAVEFLTTYSHSSLLDYTKNKEEKDRKESSILTPSAFPNYFKRESHIQQLENILRLNTHN
jgi:putative transposase